MSETDQPAADPEQVELVLQPPPPEPTDEPVAETKEPLNGNDSVVKKPLTPVADKPEEPPLSECQDDSNTPKTSRELKSILALSKEAKLDTNLSTHRRKTLDKVKGTPKKSNKMTSFPVTAESELENFDVKSEEKKTKKRKSSFSVESGAEGATGEEVRRGLQFYNSDFVMARKPNKDIFCWRCHHDGVQVACETCPRAYHLRCLKQTVIDLEHWPCPECVAILKAENTQTRSKAMKGMTLEHLCSLLKFAVKRMIQCNGSEPFIHLVDEKQFPDYRSYIVQPMTLTMLEKNIKDNAYGSTQAFEADAKWILHNSIIFNSSFPDQSKFTSAAKTIIKICKQEMAEIENCSSCYLNANTKKHTWFVEVCPKPHLLVWAKLKGFPYWPAKVMSVNSAGMADVRFFGAHDKAWVSVKDCYLYSVKDPNSGKQKRNDIIECVKELELYVDNLREIYGRVHFAPFKTPLEADTQMRQLHVFLPNYRNDGKEVIKKVKDGGKIDKSLNKSVDSERENSGSSEGEEEGEGEDENKDKDGSKGDKQQEASMTRIDYCDTTPEKQKLVAKPIKSFFIRKRYSVDNLQENSAKIARKESTKTDVIRLSLDNHIRQKSTPEKSNSIQKEDEDESSKSSPQSKLRVSDELIKKLGDLDEDDSVIEKSEEKKSDFQEKETDIQEKESDIKEKESNVIEKENNVIEKESGIEEKDKKESEKRNAELEKNENKIEENPEAENKEESSKSDDEKVMEGKKLEEVKETDVPMKELDKDHKEVNSKKGEKDSGKKRKHKETDVPVKELGKDDIEVNSKKDEKVSDKKRKHKETEPEEDSTLFPPNKMVKLVPIENILKKKNIESPPADKQEQMIVLKELRVVKGGKNKTKKLEPEENSSKEPPVKIKNEIESDEDNNDVQYMEAKRQYLSALNISEKQKVPTKPKAHEIRTRSKTEEKKSRKEENTPKDTKQPEPGKEIFIKSLSKMQAPKHKARKSFPTPNYNKKTIVARKIVPKPTLNDELTIVNAATLQPTGNVMILPKLHYTKPIPRDMSSPPMLTMLPRPQVEANVPKKKATEGSQNYIPQNEEDNRNSNGSGMLLNNLLKTVPPPPASSTTIIDVDSLPNALDTNLGVLNEILPESLTKDVNEILRQPPPKLKPKPLGILNNVGETGVPSTAGPVAARINDMAAKFGDLFRGLLIETISDLGKSNNPEATISSLKYEVEELNHKHSIELSDIRRNVSVVLKDIQKCVLEDRERIYNETKANCEMETLKRVEEAKSKQWCANCSKEAQFYCCWNTSYCDYPCQQKHWLKHMSKCTQTTGQNQNATTPVRPSGQQLVLTPTTAPKFGALFAKPQKVYFKRTNAPFKQTTGSHITLVESTPGNFELLGSGPIAVNGKILASTSVIEKIKSGNIVTVSAPSGPSSTQLTSANQKVNTVPKSTTGSSDSEH